MRKNVGSVLGMALLSLLFFACNQEYPNLLENVGNDSISVPGNEPKVLYIMVTGARGKAIQDANVPTLTQMAKHAIYSFDGIADYEQAFDSFTVRNAWANMLTGVSQTKTNTDTTWSENKLSEYPTFISRLKKSNPDWKTVALVSSDELKNKFLSDATISKSFGGDDDATVQAAIDALESDEDVKLMITQLSAVEQAGDQYGYLTTTPQYIDAIEKADAQIGQLLDALKNRESYNREKWLVIVASGKGGDLTPPPGMMPSGATGYSDMRRNTFVMFYNPQFQDYYVPKPANTSGAGPFAGKAIKLYGGQGHTGVTAEVDAADQSMFEPGDGAMTVEAKFKFLPGNTANNAIILSKGRDYGGISGWAVRTFGDNITAQIQPDEGGSLDIGSSVDVNDNLWHTLALTIWKEGNTFYARFFVDNILAGFSHSDLPAGVKLTSSAPLTFGYHYYRWGDPVQMNIADVRMWDVRLPDDVIQEYSCIPGQVPATHPYINDLIGLWPCREGSGDVFHNLMDASGETDAKLKSIDGGTIQWTSFNDVSPNICPAPAAAYYRMVPNSIDIPFEIFQWLGVNIPAGWNLDGRAWVTGYTDVRNPIN